MDISCRKVVQSEPFFSICIPVYNPGVDFLKCLASIAKQDMSDYEVVIVDDGSNPAVDIEAYARDSGLDLKKIISFRIPNGGPYNARLVLANHACGSIIVTMDADDEFIDSRVLSRLYEAHRNGDPDMVLYNATRSLDDPEPLIDYGKLDCKNGWVDLQQFLTEFVGSYEFNSLWSKSIKRSLVSADGSAQPVRLLMGEDRLRTLDYLDSISTIKLLDEPLYYYRESELSITSARYRYESALEIISVETKLWSKLPSYRVEESVWANCYLHTLFNILVALDNNNDYSIRDHLIQFEEIAQKPITITASSYISHSDERLSNKIALKLLFTGQYVLLCAYLKIRSNAVFLYKSGKRLVSKIKRVR